MQKPCQQAEGVRGKVRVRWAACLAAFGMVVAALALALAAWPFLHETALLLFLLAVLFSASLGGLGPGLLATALSTAAIHFFFMPPRYTLRLELESLARLMVFALLAFVVSALTAAKKRAGEALSEANEALEGRVRERTAELAQANAMLAQRARQQAAVAALGQRALAGQDLARLMEEAVSLVARELQAEYSQMLELLPDHRLVSRAGTGWSEDPDGFRVEPGSMLDTVLRSREAVVVSDLATERRFEPPAPLRERGAVSGAGLAIRGYRPFGVLAVFTRRPYRFSQEDMNLLLAVANVLATAADRKEAESISLGQTAALISTLDALTSRPDLTSYLKLTLAALRDQLKAEEASLWLYDPEQDCFHRAAMDDSEALSQDERPAPTGFGPPLPRTGTWWQEMLHTRRPLTLTDTVGDSRLEDPERWLDRDMQTLIFVPMLLGEEPIGLLRLQCREQRHFRMEEMDLAQALAQQATLAVQMTRLAAQGQEAALLQERNRMAREIHDNLAQGFTGIVIQLEAAKLVLAEQPEQALEHIAQARALARESLAEARRSVWALRPQALEEDTLPGALTRLVRQTLCGPSTQAAFHLHGVPRSLPADIEDNLLRIAQEALTNALRHARARTIRVELTYDPQAVRLRVRDDGQGFDPQQPITHGGLGLIGIQERTDRIGGRLTLASRPGQGTEIIVQVPVKPRPPGEAL